MKSFHLPASLACAAALAVGTPAMAYEANAGTRTITVAPQATPAATLADLRAAAKYLLDRSDTASLWTWRFQPGTYAINATVYSRGLRNVALVSDPDAPARLVKDPAWVYGPNATAEYLMDFGFCRNMSMSGFEITGSTADFPIDGASPNWQDQGVQFSSCDTVTVTDNSFSNFGNAALRFMTLPGDPVKGVNSFNTTVSGNRFDNIYQIATTSVDLEHGGTRGYRLASNIFTRLRGSVKFATRTAGASDVHIINNLIEGGSHFGIEVNGYESMEIRGNLLRDIKRTAITIYTNWVCIDQPDKTKKCNASFPWGSNFTIADNVIEHAGRGIEYAHTPSWDGFDNRPANLVIRNNALSDIAFRDPVDNQPIPAIRVAASQGISGLTVADNRFLRIGNGLLVSTMPAGSSGVAVANNNALKAAPIRDLDANLKSELVWQQVAGAGSAITQWPAPSGWTEGAFAVPAGARVAALADVDGDRRPDALLRDPATGQIGLLRASAPGVLKRLATLDTSWQLAASGDFNGDGFADMVWRKANDPTTVIWFMRLGSDGEVVIASRATFNLDATWQAIAAADFDGDAKADLLWRQPGTANTLLWLMDGATIKARPQITVDASSYMVAAGDFDGDGKAEILMRNPATGLLTLVYDAAGPLLRAESLAGLEPLSWQIGAVGDFNGDGRCDIAWLFKANGAIRFWWMNGSVASPAASDMAAPAGAWQLVR